MASKSIALIGVGRMGAALAAGWHNGAMDFDVSLIDPAPSELARQLANDGNMPLNPAPKPVDIVVIAVKPQSFEQAADSVRPWIGPETFIVSIMAGLRLNQLADNFGTKQVLRAMPNTPGSIGRGITAICAPNGLGEHHIEIATELLAPLGTVIGPVPEAQMSAITGVSGSGPAYVFLLVEALAGAGEAEGLPPDMALQLARETLIGAASLLEESLEAPNKLRKNVTSKGGTTAAALDVLMGADGIPSLIRKAVRAAASRERSLSNDG